MDGRSSIAAQLWSIKNSTPIQAAPGCGTAKRGWRAAVFAGTKLPLNSGVSGETNKRCTMLYGIRYLVPSISLWLMIMPANAQTTATRPRVDFATYLSGSLDTAILGLAVDSKGYMYVTGETSASDFPTTAGAFRRTPKRVCSNGSCSYLTTFVAKLSRDGRFLVYSTFFNEFRPIAIAVDNEGNAYVTGGLVGH
jgi:hypothetical protein